MRDLRIALRNLVRQRRRTLTTLSALIIGLAGLVVFQGFLGEEVRGFRDSTIMGGVGHLEIAGGAGYFTDGRFDPYAYALKDSTALQRRLSALPGVLEVFPSTGFTAIAAKGSATTTLLVTGYPADRISFSPQNSAAKTPNDRFNLGTLVSGSTIAAGESNRIMLGAPAARLLHARPGDVVTLMAILSGGDLAGRDFTVSGIYSSPGQDTMFAYTDFSAAESFTGITGPPVLYLVAKSTSIVSAVEAAARHLLPEGAAIRTWRQLATLYVQVNSMLMSFLEVIRAIILLVTLFILANGMSRMVLERKREWGTLRAMGSKRRDVLLIVLLEGCLQGVAGSIIGVSLGFAISGLIDLVGGIPSHSGGGLYMVLVRPSVSAVWLNIVPAVLTATVAAILPGFRAVRLPLTECLRDGA